MTRYRGDIIPDTKIVKHGGPRRETTIEFGDKSIMIGRSPRFRWCVLKRVRNRKVTLAAGIPSRDEALMIAMFILLGGYRE